MKILLLGEYSGLHNNLKQGLQVLGHEVTLAATGDGFKKFPADINFDSEKKGLIGKIDKSFTYVKNLKNLINYDIVQLINPILFSQKFGVNNFMLDFIIKNNGIVSLLGAGCDAFFWQKARYILKYGPFNDNLKYDYHSLKHPLYDGDEAFKWNSYIANVVDHIIPIMHEYKVGYEGFDNLRNCIPIPINFNRVKYRENKTSKKIVIFHGLNRYGFKGTRLIEDAFGYLKSKYPAELELIIDGHLPINEYLEIMDQTNVVIDQTYSYSCGMNAIYALAMGKIVLGGAEPESLDSLGIKNSPILNIKPTALSIIENIEKIMDCRENITDMGYQSRKFIEENHSYIKIAQRYIDTWNMERN